MADYTMSSHLSKAMLNSSAPKIKRYQCTTLYIIRHNLIIFKRKKISTINQFNLR